ncbi:HEPN domain-containing protein [Anaerosporobacter faecicola]|uniref:HEPN domain-containing protein n=1 Tax=Anaerosporobacter faecicola TaxID=2718714 RepID=UPI00143A299B|nr:HEPN domain-containing protein [Anaerosporobacter faecicola]
MKKITIDTSIFPKIVGIIIDGEKGKSSIDLPRGVNLLYLKDIKDKTEINLLEKYAYGVQFTDDEYKTLFSLFLNNTPRISHQSRNINDFIDQFGIDIVNNQGHIEFNIKEDYIQQVRVDTWEDITIDLLKSNYSDIINCFDFGDIRIDLGSWVSDANKQRQSLLNSFRSAFMYTLIGFIYGDDKDLYDSFIDYFENEFYKRIALLNGIWKQRSETDVIKYIPIFDSFYNLDGNSPDELIKTIHAVLADDSIVKDERKMIQNRLIDGALDFHNNLDPQSESLEQGLIKPVVNYLMELQTAEDDLLAAKTLLEQNLYESVINRSYYSMMHALKALLEHKNKLDDWEPGILNVNESHKALELKLRELEMQGIIDISYVNDFLYVKQKRWIADYNVSSFSKSECEQCINKAISFIDEVKRISL